MLDPALTRPGRMGRHIYFRTPTWEDRRDIFDLYLGKVAHEESLDTAKARDELARITNGYSPAMIDQVVLAGADLRALRRPRRAFSREDLLEAMTTVETGVAIGQQGPKHELRATAIHEAGHAVCGSLLQENGCPRGCRSRSAATAAATTRRWRSRTASVTWRSEEVGTSSGGSARWRPSTCSTARTTDRRRRRPGMATGRAAMMVGAAGMAPTPIDLVGPDRRPRGARAGREDGHASASRSSASS